MADHVWNFLIDGFATALVLLLFKKYLLSYVTEKGKNLATKEDIGAITAEVERVRHDYNALLEEIKARHQLRLAALDKRLQAHQEAFSNWHRLYTSNPNEIEKIAQQCRDWWNLNCVYLEPDVRQAYLDAVSQQHTHQALRAIGQKTSIEALSDHMGKMFAFPNLLFEAIQLPPLSEKERSELQIRDKSSGLSHGDGNK